MATLVATVGGSTSNAYATVATATTYFDERLNTSSWTDADADDKARALITATRRIDQEAFKGEPVQPLTDVETSAGTDTQALKWPRYSTYNDAGWTFDDDEIPVIVQHATMELALHLLNEGTTDALADTGLEGFKEIGVGPLTVRPRAAYQAGELPANVYRLLRPVLLTGRNSFHALRS